MNLGEKITQAQCISDMYGALHHGGSRLRTVHGPWRRSPERAKMALERAARSHGTPRGHLNHGLYEENGQVMAYADVAVGR